MNARHPANVYEAREEHNGERGTVVLDKGAHIMVEQGAVAKLATEIGNGKHQDRYQDAQVKGLVIA